jgi:non-ribosomal peptide synthase protein (TIGR01720 family)
MIPAAWQALDSLPLTPSGKLDHRALPPAALSSYSAAMSGDDDPASPGAGGAAYAPPSTPVEKALALIWADVLGLDRVGIHDNFFDLGGDSILSMQVISRARQRGLSYAAKDLFQHQTIAGLAPHVAGVPDGGPAAREPVTGPVTLTPIQREFLAAGRVSPHHFNQSMLVELAPGTDEGILARALDALTVHHDALRTRFESDGGQWRAAVSPPARPAQSAQPAQFAWSARAVPGGDALLTRCDLPGTDSDARLEAMVKVADDVHASFDLAAGPLLKAVLFTREPDGPYLFLAAHHLVIDGVSWRILLDDLEVAYGQIATGQEPDLGTPTTSFRDWAGRLRDLAASGQLDDELDRWAEIAATPATLPADRPPAQDPAAQPPLVSVLLDPADTEALLRAAPSAYRTRINDVLLAALARALCQWTGRDRAVIDLEGHGREDILDGVDLSRTVGWFTTIYPVALDVPGGDGQPDWRTVIKSVRRQLRAIPGNGIGYGALRYLGPPAARERLAAGPGPQIAFNYLGQWDARDQAGGRLYRAVHGAFGQDHDPADHGPHLLEVVGAVQDGRLGFTWYYRPEVHDHSTIQAVAADFAAALREIAADCRPS